MVGIMLKTRLQLVCRSSELLHIVLTGPALCAHGRRPVDRRGCADREINGYRRRGQQASNTHRDSDAPRGLRWVGGGETLWSAIPVGCRQHSSGSLGSCDSGLLGRQSCLCELCVDIRELAPEYLDASLAFAGNPPGPPNKRPEE